MGFTMSLCVSPGQSSQTRARKPPRFPDRPHCAHERFRETARIAPFCYSALPSLAFRLLPYGLSVSSRSIGQALADDALNRAFGALNVVNAQPCPIVITEIKFREIAVKVTLFAVLIHALHAAFEDRIEAFDRIGMDGIEHDLAVHFPSLVSHVFVLAVVNAQVCRKVARDAWIPLSLVGHQRAFRIDVGVHDLAERRGCGPVDMEAAGGAPALDKSQDDIAELRATNVQPLGSTFGLAHQSFVHLDDLASATHRLDANCAHGFADAMRHEPSGLKRHSQGPRKLVARNALLAGAKQVHGLQPQVHGDVAGLENGPDLHRELLPALVALVKANPGSVSGHLAD